MLNHDQSIPNMNTPNNTLTATNTTNPTNLSVPRSSDPLAVFTVLVLLGMVCIVVALAMRCCPIPTTAGGEAVETESAAASRRERERKRLEYVHKVLRTRSWHVSKGSSTDDDDDKPARLGTSVADPSLTIPSGDSDTANEKVMRISSPQHLCISEPTELEAGLSPLPDPSCGANEIGKRSPLSPESVTSRSVDDIEHCSFNEDEKEEDNDDEPLCAICLCPFEVSDRVCESNNPTCKHVFHQECLEPWLLRHEHCPVCREAYLRKPGKVSRKVKRHGARQDMNA